MLIKLVDDIYLRKKFFFVRMFFCEVVPLFGSRKGQVSGYRRANDLHKDRVQSNLSE